MTVLLFFAEIAVLTVSETGLSGCMMALPADNINEGTATAKKKNEKSAVSEWNAEYTARKAAP